MRSFMTRLVLALALGWSLASPVAASALTEFLAASADVAYARVYNGPPYYGTPGVTYDAESDLLSITAPVSYQIFTQYGSTISDPVYMSGYQTLVMNVDAHGQSSGGVFSFVGGAADEVPRLILAAELTSVSVEQVSSAPTPGATGLYIGALFLDVFMDTVFADPVLAEWGQRMAFGGWVFGDFAIPGMTDATLFQSSWSVRGPGDYWDLWAGNRVPEPPALLLAAIGLLGIATVRRHRRASSAGAGGNGRMA